MKLGDLLEMPNDDTPASCRTPERESQEMAAFHVEAELAKRRLEVIEWLNSLSPGLNMPLEVSEEELQARLLDGVVLCDILRKFSPGYFDEIRNDAFVSTENNLENVRIFISAVEQIGLPGFSVSDLQQGPTSAVVYCLWSLKDHLISDFGEDKDMHSSVKNGEETRMSPKAPSGQNYIDLGEGRRDRFQNLRSQRFLQNSVMSEPSTPESHNSGHAFHEVFQLKQGRYFDLPSAKICEILKSSSSDVISSFH